MIEKVTLNDIRIHEFLSLKKQSDDYIIAESKVVLKKLIQNNWAIYKILATPKYYDENKDLLAPLSKTQFFSCSKEELQNIVGYNLHQGVIATAATPKIHDADFHQINGNILIFNRLLSPENVGTIIRTAAALNIHHILYDHETVSPLMRRCIRVSLGNVIFPTFYKTENLHQSLLHLKVNGFYLLGSSIQHPAPTNLQNFQTPEGNWGLIVGHEGEGIEKNLIELCDNVLRIPTQNQVGSLNVATATGIILWQLTNYI